MTPYWPNISNHGGVTFNDRHTWRDWGMLPLYGGIPVISPAPPKLNLLDAPLVDGVIDQTLIPMGKIYYGVREGSMTFQQIAKGRLWASLYAEIANYLNGQACMVTLDDDPYWAYTGHVWVDQVASSGILLTVTIRYSLQPYKTQAPALEEEWNFDDVIESNAMFAPLAFKVGGADSDEASTIIWDKKVPRTIVNPSGKTLIMSSSPTAAIQMTVSAATKIYFDGEIYDATASSVPAISLPPGDNIMWFDSPNSNISIAYNLAGEL